MENNFASGDGHLTNQMASKWFNDVAETLNKTYKKQMDMSVEMSNQLLNSPIAKERPALAEDFFNTPIFKSNAELFGKNVELLSDLSKKMLRFSYDSLFNENNTKAFLDKISESILSIYEKQTKQIKDFNNSIVETLEKSSNMDSSLLGKNFKKNIEDNMDASLETIKTLLNSNNKNSEYLSESNKKVMDEMIRLTDSVSKTSLKFWTDLMNSMGQVSKTVQEEKPVETIMNTMKEPVKANLKK